MIAHHPLNPKRCLLVYIDTLKDGQFVGNLVSKTLLNIIGIFYLNMSAYTIQTLVNRFMLHHTYVTLTKKMNAPGVRLPNFPEDISENMIKYFLIYHKKHSVTRDCKGDLSSKEEGKVECKCFTSNGPISFTPTSNWDVIYFLDAREWLNKRFKLYRLGWSMKEDNWQQIVINKTKEPRTFKGQTANQKRRPRISWEDLYPQISEYTELIFDGVFEDIYRPPEQQLEPKSHSPPICTNDNLPSREEICNCLENLEGKNTPEE
jgi:hypothetical protein